MMTCRELVELLIDFLSGELSPADHARICQHLDQCPPCVTYVETYQLVIEWTRRLPCTPMPSHVVQRLYAVLQEVRRQQPPQCGGD